jgi:hypothetical protein
VDPLLRSLDSVIIRIQKKAIQPTKDKKSNKPDKKLAQESVGVEWEIELEDTGILLVNVLLVHWHLKLLYFSYISRGRWSAMRSWNSDSGVLRRSERPCD